MRYIYITTNLINNKKYIGQRNCPENTTPQKDSYLGSGILLLAAIKKYGRNNFKKEIIKICQTHKEADLIEIGLINYYSAAETENFYNINPGGQFYRSENHKKTTQKLMSNYYSDDYNYTKIALKKFKIKYHKTGEFIKWFSIAERDIYKLKKEIIKKNNSKNKKEKRKVLELVRQSYLMSDSDKIYKANKMSWQGKSRDDKIKSMKKAWLNRKARGVDNEGYLFKSEQRKQYAIKKLYKSENYLGVYLIEKGYVNTKSFRNKLYKLITQNYKDPNNFAQQISKLINIINDEKITKISFAVALKYINKTRKNKGLDIYKFNY